MKYIDLHTHSYFSDGTMSPTNLVKYASSKGLSAIALTDHDTIDGLKEGQQAAYKHGNINFINGIEISVMFQQDIQNKFLNREFHILGLGLKDYSVLKNTIEELQQNRERRNLQLIESFNYIGIDITYDMVLKTAVSKNISRVHFAKLLITMGYAKSIDEVFINFFRGDIVTNTSKKCLLPKQTIDIIRKCGGVSVLAHPFRYGLTESEITQLILLLKGYGLNGAEAMYSSHTKKQEEFIIKISSELGINICGGSDFHGNMKKGLDIGVGYGNLRIPHQLWEDLRGYK